MSRWLVRLAIILVWAAPFDLGLAAALAGAADPAGWAALFAHPQFKAGLALSLTSGTASALLALGAALTIAAACHRTGWWHRLGAASAFGLAIPHLAFAIGLGFLIMPSGLVARLLVGGASPPTWNTVQDPFAVTLTLALAIKEVPFLLATIWSVLSRGDAAAALSGQCRAAASLGHGRGSVWLRVVMPQLLPQLRWPVAAVFAYAATVVDMALVLGPAQPPPLAPVLWHDLNDAEPLIQARGLAGALFLSAAVAVVLAVAEMAARVVTRWLRPVLSAGPSPLQAPRRTALVISTSLGIAGVAAVATIALLSVTPRWPYPDLWPETISSAGWAAAVSGSPAFLTSLALALACGLAAPLLCIAWYETQDAAADRWVLGLAALVLIVPQLVSAAGQYRLFLTLRLTGTGAGLFLAHLTPALAYAFIVTRGPYRSFDGRYAVAARALRAGPLKLLTRIKLPMLKAPIFWAAAVSFAVSLAQYVPAQLMAGGRFSTLPMEAVTLSSGGNRTLLAAFALALSLPPLIAFLTAIAVGRPRWG